MTNEYTFTLGDGTTFKVFPLEVNGGPSTPRQILTMTAATKSIVVRGDATFGGVRLQPGHQFNIINSASDDGTYTINTVNVNVSPQGVVTTTFTTVQPITADTPYGDLTYTATAITPLLIPGRSSMGYGELINNNFLDLLENFCSDTAPTNPVEGQLWYKLSDKALYFYDGATWITGITSEVQSSTGNTPPTNPTDGALFYNTTTSTLYVWSDATSSWENITGTTYLSATYVSSTSPPAPQNGQFWYDSTNNILYSYVNNSWVDISSSPGFGL